MKKFKELFSSTTNTIKEIKEFTTTLNTVENKEEKNKFIKFLDNGKVGEEFSFSEDMEIWRRIK